MLWVAVLFRPRFVWQRQNKPLTSVSFRLNSVPPATVKDNINKTDRTRQRAHTDTALYYGLFLYSQTQARALSFAAGNNVQSVSSQHSLGRVYHVR